MATWLDDLKAGDKVWVQEFGAQRVREVVKVTPKQVMLPGRRFLKSSGYEIGSTLTQAGVLLRKAD